MIIFLHCACCGLRLKRKDHTCRRCYYSCHVADTCGLFSGPKYQARRGSVPRPAKAPRLDGWAKADPTSVVDAEVQAARPHWVAPVALNPCLYRRSVQTGPGNEGWGFVLVGPVYCSRGWFVALANWSPCQAQVHPYERAWLDYWAPVYAGPPQMCSVWARYRRPYVVDRACVAPWYEMVFRCVRGPAQWGSGRGQRGGL